MKKRILLVEDDAIWLEAVAKVLERGGYDVIKAPDHREALALIEGPFPIDLMLTDIVMPGKVNGIALARMALMRRRELKVIYLTGYDVTDVSDEVEGEILRKPVEDEALLLAISMALNN